MKYEAIKKLNSAFTVPEAVFDAKYEAFEKSYSGKVGDHEAPAWRAFEIAYKKGELDGDTGSDSKGSRWSSRKRSKSRSDSGDDASTAPGHLHVPK